MTVQHRMESADPKTMVVMRNDREAVNTRHWETALFDQTVHAVGADPTRPNGMIAWIMDPWPASTTGPERINGRIALESKPAKRNRPGPAYRKKLRATASQTPSEPVVVVIDEPSVIKVTSVAGTPEPLTKATVEMAEHTTPTAAWPVVRKPL